MPIKFTNNATATLASSINNAVTTITLSSGQGALFPTLGASDFFFGTLVDASNNLEIVRVTARTTDTLTVVRGQNGTTARSYTAGDKFELRVVAAAMDEIASLADAALPKAGGLMTGSIIMTQSIPLSFRNGSGANVNGTTTGGQIFKLAADNHLYYDNFDSASHIWRIQNAATAMTLDSSTNLTVVGNVTSNSDERLKIKWTQVQPNFVDKLSQVKSGIYERTDNGLVQAGVSAQSLQTLLPETIIEDEAGILSVSYGNAALVAAIELAKEVVALKAEVQALKSNKE